MRILLVEPAYYTQYPPLGLLKLSTLCRAQGHEVRFVSGLSLVTRFIPDEIKVTSLFTWAWRPVWEAVAFYRALFPRAKISLGGIYATLMPEPIPTSRIWAKLAAEGVNSASPTRKCVSRRKAAPMPAVAMPIAPQSRQSPRNRRQGRP